MSDIYNPWRESLINCANGDNYLKTQEWHDVADYIDDLLSQLSEANQRAEDNRRDAEQAVAALKLALEYWRHRQQRYKNRHPAWVEAATEAIAKHGKDEG